MARKSKKKTPTDREMEQLLNGDEEALQLYKSKKEVESFRAMNGWGNGDNLDLSGIDYSVADIKDFKIRTDSPEMLRGSVEITLNLMLQGKLSPRMGDAVIKGLKTASDIYSTIEQRRELDELNALVAELKEQLDD